MTARQLRYVISCVLLVVLVAGCASLPSSGQVRTFANNESNQGVTRVWTYAQPPTPGEAPKDIVNGFLEALASDETNFATAKKYLTVKAQAAWQPNAETDIVDNAEHVSDTGNGTTFDFSGTWIGTLDSSGYYSSPPTDTGSAYHAVFNVVRENGAWRIADPPHGVVLDQIDFQRIYGSPYNLYYPDPIAPNTDLVPCQVYLRNQSGVLTALTSALFAADCPTLVGVPNSLLSTNAALAPGTPVSIESGTATVTLTDAASRLDSDQLDQLLGSVYWTLQQVGATEVTLSTAKGDLTSSEGDESIVNRYGAVGDTSQPDAYYERGGQIVVRSPNGKADPLAFGSRLPHQAVGSSGFTSVAVSPDNRYIAVVSADRRTLYVGAVDDPAPGTWFTGVNLASPTWDNLDDLWFLAGSGASQRLLRMAADANETGHPAGPAVPVDISAYGGAVRAVKVAPDGLRMAVVYSRPNGQQRVDVALLVAQPTYTLNVQLSVLTDVTTVEGVAWANLRTLAVLGSAEEQAGAAIYEVYDDGSMASTSQIQALTGITNFAAAANAPMLAAAPGQNNGPPSVYQYTEDEVWQRIDSGTMPVYPG